MGKKKKDIKKDFTYKVVVYRDFSIDGEEKTLETESTEDIEKFLDTNGYDPSDKEVKELVDGGGEYKGLNDTEFKIELIPIEVPVEKTPFNDAELFVNEFSGYLVGKSVKLGEDKLKVKAISNGKSKDEDKESVDIHFENGESLNLNSEHFQNFIDGENINNLVLILQEEPEEIKFNRPEYKYYVICSAREKVLSGHEYKEDAEKERQRREKYGEEGVVIKTKKELSNFDLEDNNNWLVNEHDWDIIKIAINQGVEDNEYSQKRADELFENFKEKQIAVHGIKARLVYLLKTLQDSARRAFVNSNIELATDKCDLTCRVQKELKRVIAMEK